MLTFGKKVQAVFRIVWLFSHYEGSNVSNHSTKMLRFIQKTSTCIQWNVMHGTSGDTWQQKNQECLSPSNSINKPRSGQHSSMFIICKPQTLKPWSEYCCRSSAGLLVWYLKRREGFGVYQVAATFIAVLIWLELEQLVNCYRTRRASH